MSASTTPVLAIKDLQIWFSTNAGALAPAVDRVSLEVMPRQALGIVGESGSGKTQTFSSVLGLSRGMPGVVGGSARAANVDLLAGLSEFIQPDDTASTSLHLARARVDEWRVLHRARAHAILGSKIGVMAQDARRSLIPYWTVKRHLAEQLARAADHTTPDALLREYGFGDPREVLDKFPGQLSGGQAQRVLLAFSMARQPQLLIADEPTAALDTISQRHVLTTLRRTHAERSLAIVLISHDLGAVQYVADDIVVMYRGRILERAPARLLAEHERPVHPYTKELRDSQLRRGSGAAIPPSSRALQQPPAACGCPFAARCTLIGDLPLATQAQCRETFPPERSLGSGQQVACWGIEA